jgi:hypothetical protein
LDAAGQQTTSDWQALLRWRLLLGESAEQSDPCFGLSGLIGSTLAEERVIAELEPDVLDETLGFVYDKGRRGGGKGMSAYLPKWLDRLRGFFNSDVIALVQKDAIEKKGLTRLLFEPETIPYLERNAELIATLLAAKSLVPDEALATARGVVKEVVDELRKKLETQTRSALLGAIKRNSRSPLKVARNIDWQRTIRRNLHTYDAEQRRLVPEQFHFLANQRKHHEWDVVIMVDQSGSMAVSAVYSSIMAAIFASLDVLKTSLCLFNHDTVLDVTPLLTDPVDVLFTAQLGGAENYNIALEYALANCIKRPEKTLLFFITDLFHTAGDNDKFIAQVDALVQSNVKFLTLLKLSDEGRASFNHELAKRVVEVGGHCFGATPKLVVSIMERILKNQPYADLAQTAADSKQ